MFTIRLRLPVKSPWCWLRHMWTTYELIPQKRWHNTIHSYVSPQKSNVKFTCYLCSIMTVRKSVKLMSKPDFAWSNIGQKLPAPGKYSWTEGFLLFTFFNFQVTQTKVCHKRVPPAKDLAALIVVFNRRISQKNKSAQRELISARKTSNKHNNKDPSLLQ